MQNNDTIIRDPKLLLDRKALRLYTPIAMLFVSLLLITNIITQKIVPISHNGLILTAGDFIYPLSYAISVILTEVYGYAMSRRVIWAALACNVLLVLIINLTVLLPPAPIWHDQTAYALILGRTPQIVFASFTAFAIGEFIGTYVLAKLKIFTVGKYLWLRTIGATVVGQAVDSAVFMIIAFWNVIGFKNTALLFLSVYVFKVIYQTVITPLIYALARFLKKYELIDIYDKGTNFSPFHLGLK